MDRAAQLARFLSVDPDTWTTRQNIALKMSDDWV